MAKATTLSIICFEITQDPAEKTDYFFSVRGASAHPAQVESWLWQMHNALASPLPDDEVLIGCPTPFGTKEEALYCIIRAKRIVPSGGGRDYLLFDAVFSSLRELMRVDVNPLALYHSDVWRSIASGDNPIVCKVSHFEKSKGSVADLTRRLMGDNQAPSEFPAPSFEAGIAQMHRATEGIGWNQLAQASFAIGIPETCQLPIRPVVTVRVATPVTQANAQTSYSYRKPEHIRDQPRRTLRPLAVAEAVTAYKEYVVEIAEDVSQTNSFSPLWASRLWNQCQDALSVAEAAEHKGALQNYQRRFADAHESLSANLRRSGVGGCEGASVELERRWSVLNRAYTRGEWKRIYIPTFVGVILLLCLWWAFLALSARGGGDRSRLNSSTKPTLSKPTR